MGALWNIEEALRGVVECYGTLRSNVGCYGALTERYGTVTENTDLAHH